METDAGKTYTIRDISKDVRSGGNLLAVEIVRYADNRGANSSQTPMSAVVYVEAEDGSVELFQTGNRGWRASLNANGNWQTEGFDDSVVEGSDSLCAASVRFLKARNRGIPGPPDL